MGATVRALSSEQLEGLLDERENRFNATQNVVPPVDLEKLPTCLFAYPAKDNFNGSEFPRDWIRRIHRYSVYGKRHVTPCVHCYVGKYFFTSNVSYAAVLALVMTAVGLFCLTRQLLLL